MNIYILQHGEAEPEELNPERPLSEQGRRDIAAVAAYLQKTGVQLGSIMHSGKLRAAQTAQLVAETLSPALKPVQADGLKPNDDPAMFANAFMPQGKNILLVSHMPLVSRLCTMLLVGTAEAAFASVPGTLICLENTDGIWRLAYMLRPECLQPG